MKSFVRVVLLLPMLAFFAAPVAAEVETIANSVAQFSSTQGLNNWYYGYTAYANRNSYNPNTMFSQLPYYVSSYNWWAVHNWSSITSPWTLIGASNCHPNNTPTSSAHVPIRRWVSTVAGQVIIRGTISVGYNALADGVNSHIWVDGTRIYNQFHNRNTSVNYSLTNTVSVGSKVDFGVDHNTNDHTDATTFTVFIDRIIVGTLIRVR